MSINSDVTVEQAIHLTDNALQHFERVLKRNPNAVGIRLGIKNAGCSGLSYVIGVGDTVDNNDKIFQKQGVKIIVAEECLPHLTGITIDYVTEGFNSQIKFINPNVKSVCGCGESFSIEK